MTDIADKYRAEGYWKDMLLTDYFEVALEATPDKVFVKDDRHGAFTYEELFKIAKKLAASLQQKGIGRDDKFIIALPNWYHVAAFALALSYVGAVSVHMPATGGAHEFSDVLKFSNAKGIVVPQKFGSSNFVELIDSIAHGIKNLDLRISVGLDESIPNWHSFDTILNAGAETDLDLTNRPSASDVTALLFTSGSSGAPKGVVHSANSLSALNTTVYPLYDLGPDDIIFMGAPLGFSAGLVHGLRLAIVLGATLILVESWNSEKALETMARENATFSLTTPTLLYDMFRSPAFKTFGDKICLKVMLCGGMPVPATLLQEAKEYWPDTLTSVIWGMTEGIGTAARYDSPLAKIIATDGLPFLGTELKIIRSDDTDASSGEEGDLVMRGPQLFLGYYNRPELDDDVFLPERWFKTGDVGLIDDAGYLKLTGRKKELIIRGGANLAPAEIEEMLSDDPRILTILVVGVPDERLGESVCACVIPTVGNEGFCLDDLIEIAKMSGLSKAKWPERLEIIDAIPTSSTGKTQRHVLQQIICDRIAAEQALT